MTFSKGKPFLDPLQWAASLSSLLASLEQTWCTWKINHSTPSTLRLNKVFAIKWKTCLMWPWCVRMVDTFPRISVLYAYMLNLWPCRNFSAHLCEFSAHLCVCGWGWGRAAAFPNFPPRICPQCQNVGGKLGRGEMPTCVFKWDITLYEDMCDMLKSPTQLR